MSCACCIRAKPRGGRGAVLLEVVLSLALFVLAAGVIVGSLSSSIAAARQVRLEAQAADLAVSLMSEIQMGLVPATDDGPKQYEDENLPDWTWQVVTAPVEGLETALQGLAEKQVEVVIRNKPAAFACRLVCLLPDQDRAGPLNEMEPLGTGP